MKRAKQTKQAEAIAYARFSPRPNAKECESNDAQLEAIQGLCTRKGYRLVAEFQDDAASGDDMDRPGLWDAIAALRRGMVLVVESPNRMARSVYLDEMIRREVADVGARLEFVEGGQEDTPEGNMVRTIMAAVAELRKKLDAAKTSSRMRRHQAKGRRMCGTKHLPYGWMIDPDGPTIINRADGKERPARMIPDPAEQALVAKILTWTAEGLGARRIKAALDGAGDLCRGHEWSRATIERIVRRGKDGDPAGQGERRAS